MFFPAPVRHGLNKLRQCLIWKNCHLDFFYSSRNHDHDEKKCHSWAWTPIENKLLPASEFGFCNNIYFASRERHVMGYLTTYHGSILYGGIKKLAQCGKAWCLSIFLKLAICLSVARDLVILQTDAWDEKRIGGFFKYAKLSVGRKTINFLAYRMISARWRHRRCHWWRRSFIFYKKSFK